VDWEGTGNFDLADDWQNVTTAPDGSQSFVVSHVYDLPGSYMATFHYEDAEGDFIGQAVPVTSATLGGPATFGWGDSTDDYQERRFQSSEKKGSG
jgi:hypothetical protein